MTPRSHSQMLHTVSLQGEAFAMQFHTVCINRGNIGPTFTLHDMQTVSTLALQKKNFHNVGVFHMYLLLHTPLREFPIAWLKRKKPTVALGE